MYINKNKSVKNGIKGRRFVFYPEECKDAIDDENNN